MLTLNTQEIAGLLGVSRKHVTDRIVTRPDFPKPVVNKTQKDRRWSIDDLMDYLRPKTPMPLRRVGQLEPASWADMDAIKKVYAEARRISLETGIKHHVDHVLPVNGDLVSGLHVETNLQILTALDNIKKGNRFEPC